MSEWQPIETAPADGKTLVLLWFDDLTHPEMGITFRYSSGQVGVSSPVKGFKCTHWMPLPPPPTPTADE